MPRDERVLTVFVASPSDLESERNRLENAIREINVTWSRQFALRLELIRWETHGYPGAGEDAQEVLNRELPTDYDIFVGLLWTRFGTPTGRAGSGTEEEFDRARNRFRSDPDTVRVMVYFKDAPVPPSSVNPAQIQKIHHFRASLGSKGVLYWDFKTTEEFEQIVRLHLARQIQGFINLGSPQRDRAAAVPGPLTTAPEGEELGLLDLLDLVEEYSTELMGSVERINAETTALGARMQERTLEIQIATAQADGQLSRREAKTLIEKAANNMDQYVARMRTELPIFRDVAEKSSAAVARYALMTVDAHSEDRKQVRDARDGLTAIAQAMGQIHDSISNFQKTIRELPRLTAVLNRAKRETAEVLDALLTGNESGRRVIVEALKTLNSSLGEGGDPIV